MNDLNVVEGLKFPDEFVIVFQVTKKIIFQIGYYILGSNSSAHFATSAAEFNQPKSDYNRCGQCQADVLTGEAKDFYIKWDAYHLKDLEENVYNDLVTDILKLCKKYNFVIRLNRDHISFNEEVILSKM